jgi:transposase
LSALGHQCIAAAPSLIPKRPGERVKTDRRYAASPAKLHRAGELTAVWVPDRGHEAMRDLVRARLDAARALRRARQQLSGFLLRRGCHYGRPAWTLHRRWLAGLKFEQALHHISLVAAVEAAEARRDRLTAQIEAMRRTGSWRRWWRRCRRCAAWRWSMPQRWSLNWATSRASPIRAS